MVIADLSAPQTNKNSSIQTASWIDRFLAGVFDILLLVPIASFVPALHIREARIDYLQGFESNIWYQVVMLWILTYAVVQTLFLYFTQTTPGGIIMHTRVRSLYGPLSWNQCLLRSVVSMGSWIFLCLPFLEVITHPAKRAWHDRISDTVVVDLKNKSSLQLGYANVNFVRTLMILGIFFVLMAAFSFVSGQDDFSLNSENSSTENTDSLVAQALLKKDFSEDTLSEVEEKIWNSGKKSEKALAYFFKLQNEKNEDVKKALSEQICKWTPADKVGSICALSKYAVKEDDKELLAAAQSPVVLKSLTSKVFILKELTRKSQYASAVRVYQQIKKQASLSQSFKDSLKIWDVSLFWAIRENQMKPKRVPASADESEELQKYVKERGAP